MKTSRVFYYRGQIEVPQYRGPPRDRRFVGYKWQDGWSENSPTGNPLYPWVSKTQARKEALAGGYRVVFVKEKT